jgi:hypothetical protein
VREISCPGCGEVLGVPRELEGGPIRCGVCERVIRPEEQGRPAPQSRTDDRGGRDERNESDRDDDRDNRGRFDADRPRRSRRPARDADDFDRPKKKSGCGAWVIILGIVGVLGLGCCGGGGFLLYKFAGDPKWEKFNSPDARWSADFPGKPKMESKPIGGGVSGNTTFYGAQRMFGQEAFGVGYALMNEGLSGILKGPQNAREVSRRNLKMAGVDAKELTADVNDPQAGKGRMVVRIFIVENRLYTLIAVKIGQNAANPDQTDRFFDSFQLTGKK